MIPEPKYPRYSQDELTALRELVDGAYDVIEIGGWENGVNVNIPAQKAWRDAWLQKAAELVPQPPF